MMRFKLYKLNLAVFSAFIAGAAIPISTAAQNVGGGLLLLSFFLSISSWDEFKIACRQPFAIAGLALGAALVLGTLWTSASQNEAWNFVWKLRAYYLIPIFLFVFSIAKVRYALLISFAAGTFLSVILSCWAAWFNYPIFHAIHGDWFIFRTHTYHNYFAALLAVGLLSGVLTKKFTGLWRWIAITAFVLTSYDILFLVAGRTGQLVYLLMIGLVLLLWNWRLGLMLGAILVLIGAFLLPKYSDAIQRGLSNTQSDLAAYSQGNSYTSVGLRLEWHKQSKLLIQEKPFIGHGTGSYKGEYARIYGVKDGPLTSSNPHGDYLWLSVELGILGGSLLIALLLAAAWQGRNLDSAWKMTLYAMLSGMGISTLANSFFVDNITGLAFVLLTCALLNGQKKMELSS
ncbi:O-antigen ligase [uncultured Deefgea sp.]|uniref:O-antigen ligase family protein n=1 Tax=uncultured Deefgea sp. TaxID=1304914 RepID=UPI0025937006|nr:O-antigen ligase family protein [uncultured Deefgea sp.]